MVVTRAQKQHQQQQQKENLLQHEKTNHVLQRQHIEIAIICLSGCRLCAALLAIQHAGTLPAAAALLLVHVLSALLEFCSNGLGSPYLLRRSASHGIAQGVLAVPSVLAALVCVADGWQPWLQGSCSAAVAVLGVMYLQSKSVTSEATRGIHVPALHASNGQQAYLHTQASKQEDRPHHYSRAGTTTAASIAVACLVCLLAVAGGKPHVQLLLGHHSLQDYLGLVLGGGGPAAAGPLQAIALNLTWGIFASASFCICLQLLPGCFSLGEAALMAQAATCLFVAAAGAAQHAALFVPALICSQLPHSLLGPLQRAGGCTAAAHSTALSPQLLPAVISLVLAAAVAACLLLWVLHGSLQQLSQLLWASTPVSKIGTSCPPTAAAGQQANGVRQQQASSNTNGTRHATHAESSSIGTNGVGCNGSAHFPHSNSDGVSNGLSSLVVKSVALLSTSLAAAAGLCVLVCWLGCAAVWTLGDFLPAEKGRLAVLLYWVGLLAVTLPALKVFARAGRMPQIIVRKVYHLLAMGLFIPVFFWDLHLMALSLAIAFAALVLLEVLRCLRLPVVGQAVQDFMQEFVDERDAGVIYITHFTLLLGLAVPMWLSLVLPGAAAHHQHHHHSWVQPPLGSAAESHSITTTTAGTHTTSLQGCPSGGSACDDAHGLAAGVGAATGAAATAAAVVGGGSSRHGTSPSSSALLLQVMAGLSGLVIIGVGDTAASFVGKLFGRMPVHAGSSKTVEGTLAGIVASLAAWVLLLWVVKLLPALTAGQWWSQLVIATAGAGLMEAATSQLDNILLPLWYLPHLVLG